VIEVAPSQPANAWLSEPSLHESSNPPRRTLRVLVGSAGHEAERRMVQLSGLAGLAPQGKQVQLRPGSLVPVEFDLPVEYQTAGQVARLALDPADDLPSDDVTWLNLDSTGVTKVLVIESEGTKIAELQPSYHLLQALAVLSSPEFGELEVVRRPASAVLSEPIAAAELIFLAEVADLPSGTVRALEEAVARGAGLVIFPGPGANRQFYNTVLHDPLRPSATLLPVTLGELVRSTRPDSEWPRLADIAWDHPLLARLRDPVYGDFDQVRGNTWYRLLNDPAMRPTTVLARWGETPAILEHAVGAGRVLLVNSSANDRWTDLPRRPCYLPLVDRLLRYLTGGPRRGQFQVGDLVAMPLPPAPGDLTVTVQTPLGRTLTPALRQVGTRTLLQVEDALEPGPYTVSYEGPGGAHPKGQFPFVVVPDTSDSALPPTDPEALTAWWAPAPLEVLRPDRDTGLLAVPRTRWDLEPWLVGLACLCLLAEMFLVHWLCPKVNPVVTTRSRLAGEGFFQAPGNPPPGAPTQAGGQS
jgi:hypothetical protein